MKGLKLNNQGKTAQLRTLTSVNKLQNEQEKSITINPFNQFYKEKRDNNVLFQFTSTHQRKSLPLYYEIFLNTFSCCFSQSWISLLVHNKFNGFSLFYLLGFSEKQDMFWEVSLRLWNSKWLTYCTACILLYNELHLLYVVRLFLFWSCQKNTST